jgi:hypothetical protein
MITGLLKNESVNYRENSFWRSTKLGKESFKREMKKGEREGRNIRVTLCFFLKSQTDLFEIDQLRFCNFQILKNNNFGPKK